MEKNPLKQLESLGQSVWLDYISRALISSGRLRKLIREDGIRGLTSNPAIFEKAVTQGHDYDSDIRAFGLNGMEAKAIYESLIIRDVQSAADEFLPIFGSTQGRDGYVSLEVDPHLAHDALRTIEEARRLWKSLDRPNVLIKVPATEEGLTAVKQLTIEGININITLLFGIPRYRQTAEAYISGLEERAALGKDISKAASVASFFISRIDAITDPRLEKITSRDRKKTMLAGQLYGRTAVASAKIAYRIYKLLFREERFLRLAGKGARAQRILWASTGTKNPDFSDVKYIDELAGPDTISTIPVETLDAYRDHGNPQPRLEQDAGSAAWVLEQLSVLGINMEATAKQLEDEAIVKFVKPYDKLMEVLAKTPVLPAAENTGNKLNGKKIFRSKVLE